MPNDQPLRLVTGRDLEVLQALAMTPLTAEQLCRASRAFACPFAEPRRVRERLRVLADAGRVSAHRYATAGPGAPAYFILTPHGYRLLYGPDAMLPGRAFFSPLSIARQRHTFLIAEFLVHTLVAAQAAGVVLTHYARENTVRLAVGDEAVAPDASFQLVAPDGRAFNFLVELDNRSERVHSDKDADSWQRKVRLYEAFADRAPQRFRLLLVTTGGPLRLKHMLAVAKRLARNPHRSLVCGVALDHYLSVDNPLACACWRNHRADPVSLLPALPSFSAHNNRSNPSGVLLR